MGIDRETRAALVAWHALIDQAESACDAGPSARAAARGNAHMHAAIALARAALEELAGEGAPDSASFALAPALDPHVAARRTKERRDAVLRLGVWDALGRWALADGAAHTAGARNLDSLIARFGHAGGDVPPGIAPAPDYAVHPDAARVFGAELRAVLQRLADRCAGDGSGFAATAAALPSLRTVASIQRLSGIWSAAACAVFADWLHRRSQGHVELARSSLWQYGTNACPVQFRSPAGLAVIATDNKHLAFDLWTQWVLARLLGEREQIAGSERLDGHWVALRLNMRHLAGRDDHSKSGVGWRPSGLAIGMVFQTLFIDRVGALAVPGSRPEPHMAATPTPHAAPAIEVPLHDFCPGQRLTMRVVWEWGAADDAAQTDPVRRLSSVRRANPQAHLEEAFRLWRRRRIEDRLRLDRRSGIEVLDHAMLGFAATVGTGQASGDAQCLLGHVDLSRALGDDALWIDVAAAARVADRWVELPLELADYRVDGVARTALLLDTQRLADGRLMVIDIDALRTALSQPTTSLWLCRREGVGAFVSIGVDLTPPPLDA